MNRRCRWDVNLRDQTALLENAHCDLHAEKVSFLLTYGYWNQRTVLEEKLRGCTRPHDKKNKY